MNIINPTKFQRFLVSILPYRLAEYLLSKTKGFIFIKETSKTQTPITFKMWYAQKIKNFDTCHWPIHPTSSVQGHNNIHCGIETSPGYSPGNFISANYGKIFIGDYTQIAPNVGIIAENHQITDNRKFESKDIEIGRYCWLGMGSIILPGVVLGDYTIVAAGSIVTKSFKSGYVVVGGNPAKVIKRLEKKECVLHKSQFEYSGYLKQRI